MAQLDNLAALMTPEDDALTLRRVREGRCACCGLDTEDWEALAEGVKMCREFCLPPGPRDHWHMRQILLDGLNRALHRDGSTGG